MGMGLGEITIVGIGVLALLTGPVFLWLVYRAGYKRGLAEGEILGLRNPVPPSSAPDESAMTRLDLPRQG